MQQRVPLTDLIYVKEHLRAPHRYVRCTQPVTVQKLIKELSCNMLDVNVIDREGKQLAYTIPASFIDDKLHSFYEVHRKGVPLGRLYFTGIYIREPAAVKEALEMIIDEAMKGTINGHAKEISFYKRKNNQCYSQIRSRPLKDITLGRILE